MANKTNYYQNGTYSAADDVAPWAALLSNGVFTGYNVLANSPAALIVCVQPGKAAINGLISTDDAVVNVSIPANSSGYNRIDAIVINTDTVNGVTTIIDVQGVPSSSPAMPSPTASQLLLAYVLVGNGASVINQSAITDARAFVGAPPIYRPTQQMDIIDGNFQISSIGAAKNTAYTTAGYPIWDMWKWYMADTKCGLVWQDLYAVSLGTVPGSRYCAVMSWAAAMATTTNAYRLTGFIEHGVADLCGYPALTVSFWAKASTTGNKLCIGLQQHYGSGGSPSADEGTYQTITLSATWQRYTLTFPPVSLMGKTFGTNNDDYVYILFGVDGTINPSSSGYVLFTQVQLDIGSVALPYRNKSFDQELRACQRYYQKSFAYGKIYDNNGAIFAYGKGSTSNWVLGMTGNNFITEMRTAPTVAIITYGGAGGQISVAITTMPVTGSVSSIAASTKEITGVVYSANITQGTDYMWNWIADARY